MRRVMAGWDKWSRSAAALMLPRRTTHRSVSRLRESIRQNNQVSCQIRIQIDAKLSFVLPRAVSNKLGAPSLVQTVMRFEKLCGPATMLMNTDHLTGRYLFLGSVALAQ